MLIVVVRDLSYLAQSSEVARHTLYFILVWRYLAGSKHVVWSRMICLEVAFVCLSLMACFHGSPCRAVFRLRYDSGFDATIPLVLYVAGPLTQTFWIAWYVLETMTIGYGATACV